MRKDEAHRRPNSHQIQELSHIAKVASILNLLTTDAFPDSSIFGG